MKDLLPTAVAQRVKTPYPSIRAEACNRTLRERLAGLVRTGTGPLAPFFSPDQRTRVRRDAGTGPSWRPPSNWTRGCGRTTWTSCREPHRPPDPGRAWTGRVRRPYWTAWNASGDTSSSAGSARAAWARSTSHGHAADGPSR
ncbi:hypothetical protein [Streptomyces flaveolus]|uniref:Transposase n=1 Tax=Streptomyces flaveolus TaxID=67297 RepID=A0ABV3AAU1_9ACTN